LRALIDRATLWRSRLSARLEKKEHCSRSYARSKRFPPEQLSLMSAKLPDAAERVRARL
jgi:hypothetical protein